MAKAAAAITKAHSGIFTSASVEWYTPPDLLAEVRAFLGGAFYDPCPQAPVLAEGAANITSLHGRENGLSVPWATAAAGRGIFVNPPYGREIALWVRKAMTEPPGEIVMLLPSRTDTSWFQLCWPHSVCFIRGRLHFTPPGAPPARKLDGAPFPSALVFRNDRHPERHAEFARAFAHRGVTVQRMPSFARLEQALREAAAASRAARGRRAVRQPVLIAAS